MNLTETTLAKINELGVKPAAEYFDVREATIRNWINTKKVPASAAQKVLDETSSESAAPQEVAPEAPKKSEVTVPEPKPMNPSITPERIAGIELRLALLESKVNPSTGISVVPPQAQPNWTAPHNFRK